MTGKKFKGAIQEALADPLLRGALGRFGESYPADRDRIFQGIDFEGLRVKIKTAKGEVAAEIAEMADRFQQQAESYGAKVFRARTGEEASQYILELAREKGIGTIVKAKSMASEEIYLNRFLEEKGIDVVETDLGEWIVQLAGQKPSHMVMPAIHMSKEQVADLFSCALGEQVPEDIETLVKIARRELRKKFFNAGMGISGANIAVAETGTIVIYTNEGNGRLTTTLPPVHVVLVGYEKLVPRYSDIETITRLLPRSATAQRITSYVTMITGPVPTFDRVTGGVKEKELHIVLLDNGRLKMARDPIFREAFQCLRCAACLNVCPVYQLVGGHVYGHVYSGGIGNILTAFFHSLSVADNPQSLCLQCRRCTETCPGGIDIPKLVFELRSRLVDYRPLPLTQRLIFNQMLSRRKRFHGALRLASRLQRPLTKGSPYIRNLPLFFSNLAEFRSLPALAKEPFRNRIRKIEQNVKKPKGNIVFFAGCMIDFVYPEVGEAVVKVLNKRGYQVIFPEEQTCCGAPAVYSGDLITGRKLAKHNIEALETSDVRYVVSACPTCTDFLVHKYEELLKEEPDWVERAKKLGVKSIDFVKLVDQLKLNGNKGGRKLPVTYHTSCHLKRSMGIFDEPRRVLENFGCKVTEMKETDRCCGLAGSYAVKFPEISAPILERKLNHIEDTRTKIVAVDCPGCLMQIQGGLDKRNSSIKVRHTAEILAERV